MKRLHLLLLPLLLLLAACEDEPPRAGWGGLMAGVVLDETLIGTTVVPDIRPDTALGPRTTIAADGSFEIPLDEYVSEDLAIPNIFDATWFCDEEPWASVRAVEWYQLGVFDGGPLAIGTLVPRRDAPEQYWWYYFVDDLPAATTCHTSDGHELVIDIPNEPGWTTVRSRTDASGRIFLEAVDPRDVTIEWAFNRYER